MMKIRDLSIGDWVRNPTTGSNYKITATFLTPMGEMLTAQVDGEGKDIRCFSENIEPVPITPEILEKNGIALAEDYDENGGLFTCPAFSVVKYGDGYTFEVPQARVRVEHVHELQHAMRLAGIEKEIEL